jgi:DNA (cytosine-5)-methyltransferase 1
VTITVGSLCSGYGGLEMGLALALGGDVRTAWHIEYDGLNKKGELLGPRRILAHRCPDVPNYGDVKTTNWRKVEPVDWLTAGYPCQPFSLAGLRKGADDPRHLWPGVARAIGVLRPARVLLENVAAHLRDGFDVVLGDLAAMGYDASWGVVRASDAGAPHGRARLFVVAYSTGHSGRFGYGDDVRPGSGTVGRVSSAGRGAAADADGGPAGRIGRGVSRATPSARRTSLDISASGAPSPDALADAHGIGHKWQRSAWDGWTGPTDGSGAAANTDRDGLQGIRRLEPLGRDADRRCGQDRPWGAYEPAIRRWEHVLGRPAPRPTEPARRGERLSPCFVEWLMGLPEGWVTDVPGLPRNAQLKALGNGVVPQQAALACRLLGVTTTAAAA